MRPMAALYSKGPPSMESFDALIIWSSDHVSDIKRYISTPARPTATKPDRVVGPMRAYYVESNITC